MLGINFRPFTFLEVAHVYPWNSFGMNCPTKREALKARSRFNWIMMHCCAPQFRVIVLTYIQVLLHHLLHSPIHTQTRRCFLPCLRCFLSVTEQFGGQYLAPRCFDLTSNSILQATATTDGVFSNSSVNKEKHFTLSKYKAKKAKQMINGEEKAVHCLYCTVLLHCLIIRSRQHIHTHALDGILFLLTWSHQRYQTEHLT